MPLAASEGFAFADPWALGILFFGVALFVAVGALSHQGERAFSASVVYLALGALAAVGISVLGFGWVDPIKDATLVEHVTELAILVALFSAGLKVDRALTWSAWASVGRMLGIVMPLTIAAVVAFGTGVLGLSLGAAIILGAALAPTDPVLAGDIGVGPPGDEDEHEPNFTLTAEAGLNDGLAFPFVFLGVFVLKGDSLVEWVLADVLYGVVVGALLGAFTGVLLARSIFFLHDRRLLNPSLDGFLAIGAILALYGVVETVGAYGFLAVFCGGLAGRRYERDHEVNGRVHEASELMEKFGELAVILLLGSMLTLEGLGEPGWAGWGLAVLLVFVIRPVAANLGLIGSKMERPGERAYVAWFGVRGVGSLYYVAAAVGLGVLSAAEASTIVWTAIACVLLSVVVHGITAGPMSAFLQTHVLQTRGGETDESDEPESGRGREAEPVPA
jgi:NhaP-type Na+/H+ or K+/H+ antiporter